MPMSTATPILHMLSPQKHMSPFDVNMAADAGYKVIVPYINVTQDEVAALVQDAIFSRPPQDGVRTGVFIGGKDAILALDMMEAARKAMVPPFQVSVFADPAGSFTTAAAMVACVERTMKQKFGRSLKGARIAVFGATGVVGFASSIIAALEGADVQLVAHRGIDRVIKSAEVSKQRFGVDLEAVAGETDEQKRAVIEGAEIVLAAAAAGVRVVTAEQLAAAPRLLIAADVNAVPPPGVDGMELFMDGTTTLPGSKTYGIGPLAIGDIKYKTESGLFKRMIASNEPLHLDFRHAFELARGLVA
jgi:methylene-tetrahydromethanopterin dehydrogenase